MEIENVKRQYRMSRVRVTDIGTLLDIKVRRGGDTFIYLESCYT